MEREEKMEHLSEEIVTEKFPNPVQETVIQVQEARIVWNKLNKRDPYQDIL